MLLNVDSLVFRHLTYADFRHINKTGGEEVGGGGQSYIDFPTSNISVDDWREFLGQETGTRANGPEWEFTINSQGLDNPIDLTIYQRRPQSVSISSQKIESRASNRVPSWHPDNDFPEDYDPQNQTLVIYIVKTEGGSYWAGWIIYDDEYELPYEIEGLEEVFYQTAGYLTFDDTPLKINTGKSNWGFQFRPSTHNTDEEPDALKHLFEEDTSVNLSEDDEDEDEEIVERVVKYRARNRKLVRKLKELYNGACQVTGTDFTFEKPNGEYYSEVHHLIPLGEDGSDEYANMVVVSPLIHRMLHYADVSEINLDEIENNELEITINGDSYTITWDPQHGQLIDDVLSEG